MAIVTKKIEKTETEQQFDSTEPRKFELTFATTDGTSDAINILATEKDSGQAVTLKLHQKKFDEATKKYVRSEEVLERAQEVVKERFGTDIETLLSGTAGNIEFEAYTDGEAARFWPFTPYVRYDSITPRDNRALSELTGKDLTPLAIAENPRWKRFDVAFEAEIEGETKRFRVSQLALQPEDPNEPDRYLSLKYESKDVASLRDALNEREDMDEKTREASLAKLDELSINSRKQYVENFKNDTGVDLDEMLKNNEGFEFSGIKVNQITGSDKYFIVATLKRDKA